MGGEIQQHETGGVRAQLALLPIRVHRGLFHGSLPVAEADDVPVGQVAETSKAPVLQHEMI